jgi:hypothetical protein
MARNEASKGVFTYMQIEGNAERCHRMAPAGDASWLRHAETSFPEAARLLTLFSVTAAFTACTPPGISSPPSAEPRACLPQPLPPLPPLDATQARLWVSLPGVTAVRRVRARKDTAFVAAAPGPRGLDW